MSRFDPTPLNREHRRHLNGATKTWRRYLAALDQRRIAPGTIAWRQVKGQECLVHSWRDDVNETKHTRSFGPRSLETEERKRLFERAQAATDRACSEATDAILKVTLTGKDLGLGRLDNMTAAVLRELRETDLLDASFYAVDSTVVAGYEAQTGVVLPNGLEAEPGHLELCSIHPVDDGFLDLVTKVCRQVNPSFRRARDTASILSDRLNIQLFWRQHNFEWLQAKRKRFGSEQMDFIRDAIEARPVKTVAIAENGVPVEIVGPDPRNFAVMHYASEVAGLELGKERAYAVGRLVERYWPEKFPRAVFEAFPEFAAHVASHPQDDPDPAERPSPKP